MKIRSTLVLEVFAAVVSVTCGTSLAQLQSSNAISVAPLAASASTAVPALVPYSGVAVGRDGHVLSGESVMTFLVYKDQSGGEPLFIETQKVALNSAGQYTVHLGSSMSSGIPLNLFSSGEARWLEVQINGEPAQPRTLLTSVPYALKAADAATLGGLPASAFMLASSPATRPATAAAAAAVTPNAVSAVTTTGGSANYLSKFSGPNTIVNSTVYDNGVDVGIGIIPNGNAKLDINGPMIMRGNMTVSRTGNATTAKGYPSYGFDFYSNVFRSSDSTAYNPFFQLQSEPTGNNTANIGSTLNVLYSVRGGAPVETGFYINPNGTLHFAPSQVFPSTGAGAPVCIALDGGFGNGGTTFVGPGFTVPTGGGCSAWSGFTKTAGTVVLTTSGAGCVSTDGLKLTLSVSSADPSFLGPGNTASDYIQLTRTSSTGSFTSGSDAGYFSGSATQISCTASLLQLNENND